MPLLCLEGMAVMRIDAFTVQAKQHSTTAFNRLLLDFSHAQPPRIYSFYMPESCSMLGKPVQARGVHFKPRMRLAASRESGRAIANHRGLRSGLFELIVLTMTSAGNAKALLSHFWEDWVEVRLYRKGWKVAAEALTSNRQPQHLTRLWACEAVYHVNS
jgi:hypothetical protein